MICELLPACVECEEVTGSPDPAPLTPEEAATLGNAIEKRRREFALGRQCARAALARLGIGPVTILPGPKREPLWPAGVVGSITHCSGYCAAAAARQSDVPSLGIDAENYRPLESGVVERITLPEERRWIAAQCAPEVRWDLLFFSAKESVYKAWFPLTGRWLGFEDVRIEIDLAGHGFTAQVAAGGPRVFHGRYALGERRVLTAALPGAR